MVFKFIIFKSDDVDIINSILCKSSKSDCVDIFEEIEDYEEEETILVSEDSFIYFPRMFNISLKGIINTGDVISFRNYENEIIYKDPMIIQKILYPIESESSNIRYMNVFLTSKIPEILKEKINKSSEEKADLIYTEFNFEKDDYDIEMILRPFSNRDILARYPLGINVCENLEDLQSDFVLDIKGQVFSYLSDFFEEMENSKEEESSQSPHECFNIFIKPLEINKSDFIFAKFNYPKEKEKMNEFLFSRNICCGEMFVCKI